MLHCTAFCEYDSSPNEMYYKYKYKVEWISSLKEDVKSIKMEVSS